MNLVDKDFLIDKWDFMGRAYAFPTTPIQKTAIRNCPTPFDNMTNGEVMKAVFPNAEHEIWWYIENLKFVGWWDKPYKTESEDK